MEKTLNKLDEKCEHFKIPSKKEGPGGFWHCRVITDGYKVWITEPSLI